MFKTFLLLVILFKSVFGNHELFSKFHQSDYKIKTFRMELPYCDMDFFNQCSVITYKYNRTTAAVNASFNLKYDVKDKLEVLVQGYKMASNEYRRFPIRFLSNIKEAFEENVGGLHSVTKCGNIHQVYFLKNVNYYFCNFVIEENKFPPLIPSGEFKIELHLMYYTRKIAVTTGFGEVYRPIYPPKK